MNTDPNFRALLLHACKGDEDAAAFLSDISDMAHLWDDLIDKDPGPTDEQVQGGLWTALVNLPRNPFYRRHFAELNPLVANAILDWRVANRLEQTGASDDLHISFIIRSSYVCILQQTALILGGPAWAEEVGVAIRRLAHGETFPVYVTTLRQTDGTV